MTEEIEPIKSMLNEYLEKKINQCEKFEETELVNKFCQSCNISTEEYEFYKEDRVATALKDLQGDLEYVSDRYDVENAYEKYTDEIDEITDHENDLRRLRNKYNRIRELLNSELPTIQPVKTTKKKRKKKLRRRF